MHPHQVYGLQHTESCAPELGCLAEDIRRPEECAHLNLLRFKKDKHYILYVGQTDTLLWYKMGTDRV